jgi:hypothetical protein
MPHLPTAHRFALVLNKRPAKTQLQSILFCNSWKSQNECINANSVGARTAMAASDDGETGNLPIYGAAGGGNFCKGVCKAIRSLQIVEMQRATRLQ